MRAKNNTVIYRPDLGVQVLEYSEGAEMGMIGLELMPIFRTPKQSATYPVIPKEALLSLQDTSRAPRGAYNRSDWEYERGKFGTVEKGHEEPVDDIERELLEAEIPGAADAIAVRRGTGILKRGQEKRIADKLFNPANFTAHNVTNAWSALDTATPITDVNDGKSSFRTACGMLPDALVITWTAFQNLKNVEQVVERLKYTFPGIDINRMTSSQLAAVFDVPRVMIGGAVYNAANEGLEAAVTDIWNSAHAALVKISTGADLTQPGFGRTFLWTEDSPENPIVEQYREEQIRSDIFRVRHHVDERLIQSFDDDGNVVSDIAAACVYLFGNITA